MKRETVRRGEYLRPHEAREAPVLLAVPEPYRADFKDMVIACPEAGGLGVKHHIVIREGIGEPAGAFSKKTELHNSLLKFIGRIIAPDERAPEAVHDIMIRIRR